MTATATATRTYQIDKSHSEATFQVRHLITKVRGRFSDFEGSVTLDAAHPEHSSVAITIQAASIDTNEPNRDTHLRSADFFSVDEFPTLAFTSTTGCREGRGPLRRHGRPDDPRRDQARSSCRCRSSAQAKDPWGNERIAFEAEFTINRKEFGLKWNAALETGGFLVGDDVRVSLSIQAIGQ